MENFDMDADDPNEQENLRSPEKKFLPQSGIEIDALHGLLDSYSTGEVKSTRRPAAAPAPIQLNHSGKSAISTPVRSAAVKQVNTPSAANFHARSNKSEIIVEHKGAKIEGKTPTETNRSPAIHLKSSLRPYKFMFQTLYKRAQAINQNLEDFEDLFVSMMTDKSNSVLYPVGEIVQDEVPLVGRIICDSAGQLNAQSIVLEGSSRTSKSNRIRLDVSSLQSYSFFPGQIVQVIGTYTDSSCFHVKQLFDPPIVPRPIETKIKHDLTLIAASGPFLLAQGNFSAFDELLRRAEEDSTVQAVILLGPFIDERSSYVQTLSEKTYEQLFQEIIDRIKSCSKKTILIPSLRDIHHDAIYPSNPFSIDSYRDATISSGSEPSLLSIDGIRFAVTSTDILCHLSSEEISLNQTVERMSRLIRHLFQQRTFYPLNPPHESVSIEYEQALVHAKLESLPHIFITSSDLRPFVKFIDSVCAINIGRLVKNQDSTMVGNASGTYAKIYLSQTNSDDISHGNTLSDHLHIEIFRL